MEDQPCDFRRVVHAGTVDGARVVDRRSVIGIAGVDRVEEIYTEDSAESVAVVGSPGIVAATNGFDGSITVFVFTSILKLPGEEPEHRERIGVSHDSAHTECGGCREHREFRQRH